MLGATPRVGLLSLLVAKPYSFLDVGLDFKAIVHGHGRSIYQGSMSFFVVFQINAPQRKPNQRGKILNSFSPPLPAPTHPPERPQMVLTPGLFTPNSNSASDVVLHGLTAQPGGGPSPPSFMKRSAPLDTSLKRLPF